MLYYNRKLIVVKVIARITSRELSNPNNKLVLSNKKIEIDKVTIIKLNYKIKF